MILSEVVFTPQVLFAACLTRSSAEPPALSHSYGLPDVSSGYSYHQSAAPQSLSQHTEYVEQHVGHQTSEGLHLDPNLLHKIEDVLVQHENAGSHSSGGYLISSPSVAYGAPQLSYGPPSHWSSSPSKVVGIDFGHLRQSHQVAQYIAKDRYAPSHSGWSSSNSGWSVGNSGWSTASSSGWAAPSKSQGWAQQAAALIEPRAPLFVSSSSGWNLLAPKPAGWTLAKPAVKYGAPRWWRSQLNEQFLFTNRCIFNLRFCRNKSHRFIRKFSLLSCIAYCAGRWFNASHTGFHYKTISASRSTFSVLALQNQISKTGNEKILWSRESDDEDIDSIANFGISSEIEKTIASEVWKWVHNVFVRPTVSIEKSDASISRSDVDHFSFRSFLISSLFVRLNRPFLYLADRSICGIVVEAMHWAWEEFLYWSWKWMWRVARSNRKRNKLVLLLLFSPSAISSFCFRSLPRRRRLASRIRS